MKKGVVIMWKMFEYKGVFFLFEYELYGVLLVYDG